MNQLIENLNGWGENFLRFAWPMLWQSSLLITIVFALDFAFTRKIRASIRYALWIMVLVKLLLPPTLALPTGAAYWLFRPEQTAKAPVPHTYTVTYDNPMPAMEIPATTPASVIEIQKAKLNGAASLMLTSAALSFVLFAVLIHRWRQVVQKIRTASDAEKFSAELERAKFLADMRAGVRLKIVDAGMSPAVCGLFRPVILLPRALAEKLSSEQLRSVLLHEIFHLRRRDVWVNCAQALLQIFYWWHPLMWVANARIRRVREEAVDDAVMLALRDEAETYASTLLEVAKLALRRPLMSLGLVGIMESRSTLRQRVERLVDFRAPRKAGLTLVSMLGIFAFSAVALPMGEAPEKSTPDANIKFENEGAIITTDQNPKPIRTSDNYFTPENSIPGSATASPGTNPPSVFIQAAIYRMHQADFEKIVSAPAFVKSRQDQVENLRQFNRLVKSSGFNPDMLPRLLTQSGQPAEFYTGDETNHFEFYCLPVVTNGLVDLENHIAIVSTTGMVTTTNQIITHTSVQNGGGQIFSIKRPPSSGETNIVAIAISVQIVTNTAHFQQRLNTVLKPADGTQKHFVMPKNGPNDITSKLNVIRLENFSCTNLPLGEVLHQLAGKVRFHDPDHVGINFMFNPNPDRSGPPTIDPSTGLPMADVNPGNDTDSGTTDIPVTIAMMQNVTLGEVLNAVVKGAAQPVHYVVHDYGINFLPGTNPPVSSELFTRTFKVDPNFFMANLKKNGIDFDDKTNFDSAGMRKFVASLGVDMNSPAGKTVFLNEKSGVFLMRGTEKDLNTLDKAIQVIDYIPPQIHIKARFIEITRNKSAGNNSSDWYLGSFNLSETNGYDRAFESKTNAATLQPVNPAGVTGILTDKNFRVVLHALESRPDVENLGEPEVTTTSGRQTQMRTSTLITVLTNFTFQESVSNKLAAIMPQMEQVETGPVLDVVPCLLSDGYTVNLSVIPSVTEFLGYESPPDYPNFAGTNNRVQLPVVLPKFSTRRMTANLNVWDGQTVVLSGMTETRVVNMKDKIPVLGDIPGLSRFFYTEKARTQEADLLVFITANIVDPAGNRIHADDELPFAQKGAPAQPHK